MVQFGVVSALVLATGLAVASPSPAPLAGVRTRNLPGTSDEDTLQAVHRSLAALARTNENVNLKNSTSIEASWDNAVLFTQSFDASAKNKTGHDDEIEASLNIEVTCSTCYFKANVTAALSIQGDFDLGATLKNVTAQFGDEINNFTDSALHAVETVVQTVGKNLTNDIELLKNHDHIDLDDLISFDNITLDTDFHIVPPPLPEVELQFSIDFLDLYVALDFTIDAHASFTLPLYKSESALGISVPDGTEFGVFVTMDLLLSVDGELSIQSGFHLLLDKPVGFKIALFSSNVSEIIFNGGKFEFLPVKIISGNVALKAILRVGMHAGINLKEELFAIPGLDKVPKIFDTGLISKIEDAAKFSAGVEVGVYAHVAEFLTNITGGANLAATDPDGCALKIVEEYTLGLGAFAGATIAIGSHTWGGQPNTTVPIFYTTLADVCAAHASATPTASTTTASTTPATPAPTLHPRQNLKTTTISTTVVYTGIGCASPGLPLCPSSLQTTSLRTSTLTLTTAVPPGVTPTFPATTATTVASTIPFGKKANDLTATSGAPTSFVPPPPPPSTTSTSAAPSKSSGPGDFIGDINHALNGETNGVSNKLIIGLSVGLGVPFLAAVIAGIVQLIRKRRYAPLSKTETSVEYTGAYQSPMAAERQAMLKKGPAVAVGEVPHAL